MHELRRSQTNRIFLGVCGGLSEYFDVDANIIRILFLVLATAGGASVLLYLILALLMGTPKGVRETPLLDEVAESIKKILHREWHGEEMKKRNTFGLIISLIGLYVLLYNLNLLASINYLVLWPIFCIALGVVIYLRGRVNANTLLIIIIMLLLVSFLFSNNVFHLFAL